MNWESWDSVRLYLLENNRMIPKDKWVEWQTKYQTKEDLSFQKYINEHFRIDKVNKKTGEITGRTIHYNMLKKYFCSIYSTVYFEEEQRNLYIYNGRFYEKKSLNILGNFMANTVLEANDLEGLAPSEIDRFTRNIQTLQQKSKKIVFESTRYHLNFLNGIFNVQTFEFQKHSPKFYFLYSLPYKYTEEKNTDNWDKLLKLITCDKPQLIKVIEFYLGYILSMETSKSFQFFLMLFGDGNNGKTFFLDVLKKMLTEHLYTSQKIQKMADDKFAASAMENKIAIFSDDEKKEVFFNPTFIKELVGGNDKMTIERKYQDVYEIDAIAKPIITTNKLPFLPDTSFGFIRRFLLVPLEVNLQDVPAQDKIKDIHGDKRMFIPEFPAIIRKCLTTYYDSKKNGFTIPDEVLFLQKKLSRHSNHIESWFDLELIYTGNKEDRIPEKYLYDCYCDHVEDGKFNRKKRGNFRNELENWVLIKGKKHTKSNKFVPYKGEMSTKNKRFSIYLNTMTDSIDIYSPEYEAKGYTYNKMGTKIVSNSNSTLIGFMMRSQYEQLYDKELHQDIDLNEVIE